MFDFLVFLIDPVASIEVRCRTCIESLLQCLDLAYGRCFFVEVIGQKKKNKENTLLTRNALCLRNERSKGCDVAQKTHLEAVSCSCSFFAKAVA